MLEALVKCGIPLPVHGEVVDPVVDVFDREGAFIERVLIGLLGRFPWLKVVLEHITTREAVDIVLAGPLRLTATVIS